MLRICESKPRRVFFAILCKDMVLDNLFYTSTLFLMFSALYIRLQRDKTIASTSTSTASCGLSKKYSDDEVYVFLSVSYTSLKKYDVLANENAVDSSAS